MPDQEREWHHHFVSGLVVSLNCHLILVSHHNVNCQQKSTKFAQTTGTHIIGVPFIWKSTLICLKQTVKREKKNGEHNFTRRTDVTAFDAAHLITTNRYYYLHRHRVVIFVIKFHYLIEIKSERSAGNIRHSDSQPTGKCIYLVSNAMRYIVKNHFVKHSIYIME